MTFHPNNSNIYLIDTTLYLDNYSLTFESKEDGLKAVKIYHILKPSSPKIFIKAYKHFNYFLSEFDDFDSWGDDYSSFMLNVIKNYLVTLSSLDS